MKFFSKNLKRIKKEISDLVKNEKYDQILDKLNLLEAPSFLDTNYQHKALIEKKLIDSEEKFRKLTELSPAAICIQTTERFLWANPAWAEISGYSLDEVLNMGIIDIVHPDMQEEIRKRSEARLNKGNVESRYNLKIVTKDKKVKWVDVAISVIEFEGQIASLAVSTDITKVVETQQALKKNEAKYKSLIENLRHEYFFYRYNAEGIFEYVSPSVEYILGYQPKDFITHYAKYLTDNPINQEAIMRSELAMQGIQQLPYELEIYDIQKNIHIMEVSETPNIDSEGNVISVEGIVRDITSQKRAEEKLKESERQLQTTIAQKDKFFSLLAHDLRSPIGNFLQISELLKTSYESLSTDQINGFFDNLYSLSDITFKLLENLLMWSRSQLGRLESRPEDINLFEIVTNVGELYEENLKRKDIKLRNEIPLDLIVQTDLNFIQTILRNLISNAIKFSYTGGSITIQTNFKEEAYNDGEFILISVKDKGIGIPKDVIDIIFDIDTDYSTLGTASEKGTGLGLILCKELVEKNGGKIWVESDDGDGSAFYFTLKR